MHGQDSHMPEMARQVPAKSKGKEKMAMSIASNLARSASGLAREVVGTSDIAEFSHGTSNALDSSKLHTGDSSRTPRHWVQDTASHPSPTSTAGQHAPPRESFRSNSAGEPEDCEVNEFLNGPSLQITAISEAPGKDGRTLNDVLSHLPGDKSTYPALQGEPEWLVSQEQNESRQTGLLDDEEIEIENDRAEAILSSTLPQDESQKNESLSEYENLTVKRLHMILGHIAKQEHMASTRDLAFQLRTQHFLDLQPTAFGSLPGQRTESNQWTESEIANNVDFATHRTFRDKASHLHHAHLTHQRSAKSEVAPDESSSNTDFHCARPYCRQRFDDPEAIRPYPGARWGYVCPHEDCDAQFQTYDRWNRHILQPHHGMS